MSKHSWTTGVIDGLFGARENSLRDIFRISICVRMKECARELRGMIRSVVWPGEKVFVLPLIPALMI